MTQVVLDPGHGGAQRNGGSSPNNATGPTGLLEKTLTLDVARRARTLLAARGIACALSRDGDVNPGLAARAHVARDAKARVFVSIHFNGWKTPDVQGTETFVHERGSARSLQLAGDVQSALLKATGLKDRRVKRARFGVLAPASHAAETAACLAEISFLTDPAEEARLKTATYLDRIATALSDGIAAFLARK
jgi:N-acetylmuramoyl-L-alanine amidase